MSGMPAGSKPMQELTQSNARFVAFVGAGASAIPPSNLPGWNQFNNLLLECLCERLGEYSGNRQPTAAMLDWFRQRRDQTRYLAPDFQAQLMEEEVGADYFHVWQSLETDVYGPVHTGLAELASKGRLAAIITTNFDRLIEISLDAKGQPYQVFHDAAGFEALLPILKGEPSSALPVVKIHGSIEDPASLIDTLKQRVVGRPEALMKGLRALLRTHLWLFLGFSGADLSYNQHYLGILDAAAEARGFVFLARKGKPVEKGVEALRAAYGTDKADIVYGDLSFWLSTAFGLAAPIFAAPPVDREDTERHVKDNIRVWVEHLGPLSVVNIVCAMLKNSRAEVAAHWLLRKTWKSYRTPDDTRSKSYARYQYNYGLSLFENGFIVNPISLKDDMSNALEWKAAADQDAYEYFARSYDLGGFLPARAQLAAVMAYRGQVGKAIAVASAVKDAALATGTPLDLCDIALASAVVYDIVHLWGTAIAQLRYCLDIAKTLGDEPRRALLCAHLGRFLAYTGDFDGAIEFIQEAEDIGKRLDLPPVLLASKAARGLWLALSGTSVTEAVEILQEVVSTIEELEGVPLFVRVELMQTDGAAEIVRGRHPFRCRVLLDLNAAGVLAGDAEVVNRTLDELDALTADPFVGYYPLYCLAYIRCLMMSSNGNQRDLVQDLLRRMREVGEATENPWVPQAIDYLERQLESQR